MFYSNFYAIKHCEIKYVNRNVLFCINLTLILQYLNVDEMTWYEASRKKIKFRRDDLVRDGFGARSRVGMSVPEDSL